METIYINGEIGYEITAANFRKELPEDQSEKLQIIINSPGGFVSEGMEIYNLIKSYKGEVDIIIGVMAASIAAYISMAVPSQNRKAFKNSSWMTHEASCGLFGRARDFKIQHERLLGVNSMLADAYSEGMMIDKTEALKLMEEDFYLTGWEQLLENNIISDIVDPADIDIPEPMKTNSIWEFLFDELEKEPDYAKIKEKMYATEDKVSKNWEENNKDFEKAVALLNINKDLIPVIKPVENNTKISMEDKMETLQEFLKVNLNAKAEFDIILQSAKAEDETKIKNLEKTRIVSILEKAGVKLSENIAKALDSDMDVKDFALAELDRINQINSAKDKQTFGSLVVKETPGDQDEKGKAEAKAKAEVGAITDEEIKSRADKIISAIENDAGGI